MREELISFETAKLAKEKGFDVYCETAYVYRHKEHESEDYVGSLTHHPLTCDIGAPTQSLLQKWLREKHNVVVQATYKYIVATSADIAPELEILKVDNDAGKSTDMIEYSRLKGRVFDSYEDTIEAGLQEALKLI
jgi:hypothetical protein